MFTPDPLTEQVAELLGHRPFVLQLLEVAPEGDDIGPATVRALVHDVDPLGVLALCHGLAGATVSQLMADRHAEHATHRFREQLEVDGIPLAEWVDNARRAHAERHADVQGVLDDVLGDALPVDADEQRFVPLEGEDGDRG